MKKTEEKALDYFKSNAETKELFGTTDGYLFIKKQDAVNHATTLNADNLDVETFTNGKSEKEELKKLSIPELKALKEQAIAAYTELFEEAPDKKLSGKDIQKLIDEKRAELKK